MFLSTFEKQLDSKRRIVVPQEFRAAVSGLFDGIFCFPAIEADCLEAGGKALFDRYLGVIEELPFGDPTRSALEVSILGGMAKLSFDTAGRITLPDQLCEMCGLTDWVTVVGMGERFQIWSREAFQAHRAAQRDLAREGLAALRTQQRVAKLGERVVSQASHVSVLLDEVVQALGAKPGETIIDGTFGAGGYTRAILATGASVVGFDRDPTVQRFAEGLPADRFRLIQDRFSQMAEHFEPRSVDGVVLDIGVSSMQLDEAERGFSFMRDGPLDMRMSDTGPTAADLVNELDHTELARILYVYGEEHASRRIASFIVKRREERKFERTLDLAHVIERALGGRKGAKVHPATRSFQGLRIAVNDELGELEAGLAAAERILKPGGRLAVVTFHSLEDRIVKNYLAERAGRTPGGSRHLPQAPAGAPASFQLIANKAIAPGEAELAVNPRARSSKLRAAVRTEAPVWEAAA